MRRPLLFSSGQTEKSSFVEVAWKNVSTGNYRSLESPEIALEVNSERVRINWST